MLYIHYTGTKIVYYLIHHFHYRGQAIYLPNKAMSQPGQRFNALLTINKEWQQASI